MAQTTTNLPPLQTGALVFTAETVLPPWEAQAGGDTSDLLSAEEAVHYLRLNEGRPMRAALCALSLLVKQRRIPPWLVSFS